MTDYAKKLAEIEAWADHLGALDDLDIEGMTFGGLVTEVRMAEMHIPWLLKQIRAVSKALAAAGIPDDNIPLGERVTMLMNERDMARGLNERAVLEREKVARGETHKAVALAAVDRVKEHYTSQIIGPDGAAIAQHVLDLARMEVEVALSGENEPLADDDIARARAMRDLDILRRAAVAATTTLGKALPDDARPATIAAALWRVVKRSRDAILTANNTFFEVNPDDAEHVIECHPATLPEEYRRMCSAVTVAQNALTDVILEFVEPGVGDAEALAAGPQTDEDRADVARVIARSCVDEEEAWHRVQEERFADPAYRAAFNTFPNAAPRVVLQDGPPATEHRKRGAAIRELRRMGGKNLEEVAIALRVSIPDVSALERGAKTTDDAGWREITTVLFMLGGGMTAEHVADPGSSPAFARAMAADDEPEAT